MKHYLYTQEWVGISFLYGTSAISLHLMFYPFHRVKKTCVASSITSLHCQQLNGEHHFLKLVLTMYRSALNICTF